MSFNCKFQIKYKSFSQLVVKYLLLLRATKKKNITYSFPFEQNKFAHQKEISLSPFYKCMLLPL